MHAALVLIDSPARSRRNASYLELVDILCVPSPLFSCLCADVFTVTVLEGFSLVAPSEDDEVRPAIPLLRILADSRIHSSPCLPIHRLSSAPPTSACTSGD